MEMGIWALFLAVGGMIAGWQLFRYLLRNKEGFWSSLFQAFMEAWFWLPGFNRVRELKDENARHEAFLKRRRERPRGNLTDDF